ncbi:MAG: response regulator [Chloroflexota bacterium]
MAHQRQRSRLLLVDDQPLFRKALASLINGQADMVVVAEAEDGLDAVAKVQAQDPDLVVMDVQMPNGGGAEGVRRIRSIGSTVPIIMLTISEEDDDLFDSVKAGANGYLLKNMHPDVLFEYLRSALRGEAPIAPAMAHKLLTWFREGSPARPAQVLDDGVLTRRETEILQLVAEGMSNKEIAARLVITEGTVKNHVHNSLEKLHLSNRTQAAAYAVRQGFVGRPAVEDPTS